MDRSSAAPAPIQQSRISTQQDSVFFQNTKIAVAEPSTYAPSQLNTARPLPQKQDSTDTSVGHAKIGGRLRRREAWAFWLSFLGSICLGIALAYGLLGPIYASKPFERTLPEGYGSGIYLLGVVETLDLDSRTLGVQWLVHSCEESGPYSGCNALTEATNFYLDQSATPSSTFDEGSAALVYKPNLQGYITDGFCVNQTECWDQQVRRGVPYEQTLHTEHKFSIRPSLGNWRSNSQAYPFDQYGIYATFLAIDPATNASRPILGARLTGTIPNFGVELSSRQVTISNSPLQWRMITMMVHRSEVVVGFAFLIWVVNWLVAGVVLWITVSSIEGRRKIPGEVIAVPIGALFALPTVRQAMPASPAFGTILDYSGIIMNIAIVSLCSVALLLAVIARDGKERHISQKYLSRAEPSPLGFFSRVVLRRKGTSATVVGAGAKDDEMYDDPDAKRGQV